MNLSDRELLELNDLCGAVTDGTITETQRARLAQWLQDSETARRHYVRALDQSASLHAYAAEVHADAPDRSRGRRPGVALAWWGLGALAAAAAGAVLLWPGMRRADATEGAAAPYVARITAAKDARWSKAGDDLQSGAILRAGRQLELEAGIAEITFDSGARVVLTGAALLEVNSAWDASLRRGTLSATVPAEAAGFRIANSAVEVVDLGTEFSMVANANGSADVFVRKGEVEAVPRVADAATILLRENETRRFAASGISDVRDRGELIARLTQPLALDRFAPATRYVLWTFDEGAEGVFPAEVVGKPPGDSAAHLSATDTATLRVSSIPGQRGRALHFDGQVYATANFSGISGDLPRTVAFWVKVPEDAKTDAWMVSWGTEVKKLSSRPVQISWNRRPGEGPFGALRTDFGGGYAIGSQDLRDGRWHHVAVSFAADGSAATPVQVKQYIDGRLESSAVTLTPGKVGTSPVTGSAARRDVVWLGCRLTGKQPERFRGELDELFIADRSLEPGEIVALMRDNQPPVAGLAQYGPPAGIAR